MSNARNPQQGSPKNIVLEGLDRTGKSTIAEIFARVGYHVYHARYTPYYADMAQFYQRLIQEAVVPAIFDRSFISEAVYGPVLRGGSRLLTEEFLVLLEHLAARDFVVVYLRERPEIVRERLAQTLGTHTQVFDHLQALGDAYDTCMEMVATAIPTCRICPTAVPQEHLFHTLMTMIAGSS
jgi:thymidylate kinase